MMAIETASVFTHRYPEETAALLELVIDVAVEHDVTLTFNEDETEKHRLSDREGLRTDFDDLATKPDLCITLGGDGTILYGLRRYVGARIPVFPINFGRTGFLAAVEQDQIREGLTVAFNGEFETVELPTLNVEVAGERFTAVNDVAFQRKPDLRVASLAYAFGAERLDDVYCDGLVVATPAGSTGYNLANGGPILAWGVEGYVVSFVAPHTLTARPLLAAAGDVMSVCNLSKREPVAVSVDGRSACDLESNAEALVAFSERTVCLAQMPGTNFYRRFREKFGKQ